MWSCVSTVEVDMGVVQGEFLPRAVPSSRLSKYIPKTFLDILLFDIRFKQAVTFWRAFEFMQNWWCVRRYCRQNMVGKGDAIFLERTDLGGFSLLIHHIYCIYLAVYNRKKMCSVSERGIFLRPTLTLVKVNIDLSVD